MPKFVERGETVLPREGSEEAQQGITGLTTGGTRRCTLEGCRGIRVGVRWSDGKLTWPCSKGMRCFQSGHITRWEIL